VGYNFQTMAEADPLQRIKSAAYRSEGPISVETQRRRHFESLDLDFGLDAETKRRREKAIRPSRLPSLTRVIAYIMLFCLLLIAAMTIRLWYDGTLGRFAAANLPSPSKDTGWMLPRDADYREGAADVVEGAANSTTPLPSFIEPLPVQPPAPQVAQTASQSEADEETETSE
jgi:hypothetical protein